ncbi:hypothetical protein VTI74DRAFT_3019 [Chaetomium olivicolor]
MRYRQVVPLHRKSPVTGRGPPCLPWASGTSGTAVPWTFQVDSRSQSFPRQFWQAAAQEEKLLAKPQRCELLCSDEAIQHQPSEQTRQSKKCRRQQVTPSSNRDNLFGPDKGCLESQLTCPLRGCVIGLGVVHILSNPSFADDDIGWPSKQRWDLGLAASAGWLLRLWK